MTTIKIFTHVVGTIACLMGIMLCLILLFPSKAIELGVTDGGLRAQFFLFVGWMFLFAVSLHVYVGEARRK
jgi:hypothetical protein